MDAIVCGFELYMLWELGRNLLRLKDRNIILQVVVESLIWFGFIAINSMNSSVFNFIFVPGIYILFAFWNFNESVLKRFCLAICYYALVILPEFLFALLANVDSEFYYRLENNDEMLIFVTILLMKMITFILVKCVEQIHKRKYYEEEQDKFFLSLMVLPLSTIVFLCGLYYSDFYMTSTRAKYMVLAGTIMLIFANVFVFHLFNKMLVNENKAQKLERLYLKGKMEKKYLEQVSKADEERRKILHDINKYVRTAANCISVGDIDASKEIFEKLNIKIQETKPIEYSENKIINVIMTDRTEIAKEEKIEFVVKIESGANFAFMDEIDLIAILGNLLDNAFEAARLCGKNGFVNIRIFTENQGHFLVINVDNNYMIEPVHGGKGYLTIKKDGRNHGIGIHTVEQIVKHYKGKLQIDINKENKIFAVTIIFQL